MTRLLILLAASFCVPMPGAQDASRSRDSAEAARRQIILRDGLILSRKYSEMQLANLTAAGRAAREAAKR